jgi:hypothetical protein
MPAVVHLAMEFPGVGGDDEAGAVGRRGHRFPRQVGGRPPVASSRRSVTSRRIDKVMLSPGSGMVASRVAVWQVAGRCWSSTPRTRSRSPR